MKFFRGNSVLNMRGFAIINQDSEPIQAEFKITSIDVCKPEPDVESTEEQNINSNQKERF